MNTILLSIFVTLVLWIPILHAAPTQSLIIENPIENEEREKNSNPYQTIDNSGLILTTPDILPKLSPGTERSSYFERHSLGFKLGPNSKLSDTGIQSFLFGLTYIWPKLFSPKWEFGALLLDSSRGVMHMSRKYQWRERLLLRPYTSFGIGILIGTNDGLAAIVNVKNYLAIGHVGFEWTIWRKLNWKVELQTLLGHRQDIALLTGLTLGF